MDLESLVRRGLSGEPKTLPAVLFYDATGSELFEEITRTPEYYLTRTEEAILEKHADAIIQAATGDGPLDIVELGAGSAQKTRILLRNLVGSQGSAQYFPIDVSPDAILPQAASLEQEMPGLEVSPIVGDNAAALRRFPTRGPARLILFIGSSIGNFEPADAKRFLRDLSDRMRPEDGILLGTDLIKDGAVLDAAYNDASGVTARFNLNALARLNREYGADFELSAFAHKAFFRADKGRVEMHLVSQRSQRVRIPKLDLSIQFELGETIHTENSHKYTLADIRTLADAAHLTLDTTWMDDDRWFGVHLLRSNRP